jgi:UDP-2,3-diacylglucosamine pyrophosphatase LpxH
MKKRVFVSDIHMGTGLSLPNHHRYDWLADDQARAFANFLAYIARDDTMSELILVGDLLDNWEYPIDLHPPQYSQIAAARRNPDIIDGIRKIARNKTKKVTYLVGNHDITVMNDSIADFGNGAYPNISFQEIYDVDGLLAMHGHQYIVWNASDPLGHRLPIGHYVSRLQASLDQKEGQGGRWQDSVTSGADALLDLLKANADVNIPLDFLTKRLKIDPSGTPILTVDGGTTTVVQLKKDYKDLTQKWNKASHPDSDLVHQFKMERASTGFHDIARFEAKRLDRQVLILGHTHHTALEDATVGRVGTRLPNGSPDPSDKDHPAVYANCGSWCAGGGGEPRYSWVEDEYDETDKSHRVTVMNWADGNPQPDPSLSCSSYVVSDMVRRAAP